MTEPGDGGDLKGSLTKKIGGLPGFAWIGIALVLIIVYKKYAGGSSLFSSLSSPSATTTTSQPLTLDANGNPILPAGSNALWAQSASDQLLASGSYNPSDIQTALANYQSGNGITTAQQSIIDAIIHGSLGTPPEGIVPVAGDFVSAQSNQATIDASNEALSAASALASLPIFTPAPNPALSTVGHTATDPQGYKYYVPASTAPQINPNYIPNPQAGSSVNATGAH